MDRGALRTIACSGGRSCASNGMCVLDEAVVIKGEARDCVCATKGKEGRRDRTGRGRCKWMLCKVFVRYYAHGPLG